MDGEMRTASTDVVQTVAESTNNDPVDLPPLYETIDPDALDSILEETVDGWVSFTYAGVEVTATSEGGVAVNENPGSEPR